MPTLLRPIALFSLLTLAACAGDDVDPDDTGVQTDDTDTDTDTASDTTYADVAPILEQHCTSCHADPPVSNAPFALTTYEDASGRIDRIVARGVDGDPGPMPPSGLSLSEDEMDTLLDWQDAGTPE